MTSIDWLQEQIFLKDNYNNIRLGGKKIILELFEKAREMHKQEIINSWSDGACGGQFTTTPDTPEEYYQETLKQSKQWNK